MAAWRAPSGVRLPSACTVRHRAYARVSERIRYARSVHHTTHVCQSLTAYGIVRGRPPFSGRRSPASSFAPPEAPQACHLLRRVVREVVDGHSPAVRAPVVRLQVRRSALHRRVQSPAQHCSQFTGCTALRIVITACRNKAPVSWRSSARRWRISALFQRRCSSSQRRP